MNKVIHDKIEQYGGEIDRLSINCEFDKLKALLDEMIQFAESEKCIEDDAAFNYYLGTGLGTYSDYLVRSGKAYTDSNVIETRRLSMLYLRRGIVLYDPAIHTDPRAKLRILTNYANGLDTAGRVIEALRIYREVLQTNSNFSIALGNYGRALQFLANMVNDSGHFEDIHCYAYQALKKAVTIEDPDLHNQAIDAFTKAINDYEVSFSKDMLAEPIVYDRYEIGKTDEEVMYRKWCLRNHLFLNPLNDVIETESAFAHDPLTITTYTEDNDDLDAESSNSAEPPRWFAMLNQLKEEYIYARYLCFAGFETDGKVHFADREVKLILSSYDYPSYSIRIEHLKNSFRILYSILDQICFFINDYWKLGIPERGVSARNICKANNYPRENVPLNSLYWLLCEFFETYGDDELQPEKRLVVLRNALEHKFVKIHKYNWDKKLQIESDSFYHISEEEMKKQTMRLLTLIREALLYLVYAVGVDESKRKHSSKSVVLYLSDYSDEWKE